MSTPRPRRPRRAQVWSVWRRIYGDGAWVRCGAVIATTHTAAVRAVAREFRHWRTRPSVGLRPSLPPGVAPARGAPKCTAPRAAPLAEGGPV